MGFLTGSSGPWSWLTCRPRVWAALTTAEGLAAWFGNEAAIDLRRPCWQASAWSPPNPASSAGFVTGCARTGARGAAVPGRSGPRLGRPARRAE
jgi:hypothetical protein